MLPLLLRAHLRLWEAIQVAAVAYFGAQIDKVPGEMQCIEQCISQLRGDSGHEGMYDATMQRLKTQPAFQAYVLSRFCFPAICLSLLLCCFLLSPFTILNFRPFWGLGTGFLRSLFV